MLDGRNSILLLLNSVSVENQNIGLGGAAVFTITFVGLLVPQRLYLHALNVRVPGLAFEAFQSEVVDGIARGGTGVLYPTTHAARDDAACGDDKAGSQQHFQSP